MIWVLACLGAAYLVVLGTIYLRQRDLLYHPQLHSPTDEELRAVGLAPWRTTTADGLTLRHFYMPPESESAPVMVVFHGNAGSAAGRAEKYFFASEEGAGLLLAEYRAFGGNPGSPSEEGLLADGRSVLKALVEEGVAAERIVLYGESLGSGVSVAMAGEHAGEGRPLGGVILEAPFTSVAAAAQRRFWYLPAYWLVRDRFDSLSRIDGLGAPLLILHGERDRTIPFDQGRALFQAAPDPKEFLGVAEAGHVDLHDFPQVDRRVRTFLADMR